MMLTSFVIELGIEGEVSLLRDQHIETRVTLIKEELRKESMKFVGEEESTK